ncbi:MAG: ABC transporter ATP-binding protein [Spirochaetes bacterium]|nr:ABC transporter ATP-binding protein [Spirochaetota bacterium]
MRNNKDIILSKVSFSYSDKIVFDSLSAVFKKGKLTSLIGPNGSGKTTLLKLLCGIYSPLKGNIFLGNYPADKINLKQKSAIFASVFSSDFQAKPLKVKEFVLLCRYPLKKGISFSNEDYAFVEKALSRCKIDNLSDKLITHLSAGELQLVLLAGCIAKNSEFIIMDEPVSHLDIKHASNIYSILRSEADSGKTVIASVHDINTAIRYSDIITGMNEFSVIFSGTPDRFLKENIPHRIYGIAFKKTPKSASGKSYIFPA